jgi:chromosome segregation ATPase
MDKRLSKLILDPVKLESLVVRYESAAENNKKALAELTGVKGAADSAKKWLDKAEKAKKAVMEAEAEVRDIHDHASEKMAAADKKMFDAKKYEETVIELSSNLLEKEAALNNKLKDFADQKMKFDEIIEAHKKHAEEIKSWVGELSDLLSRSPL